MISSNSRMIVPAFPDQLCGARAGRQGGASALAEGYLLGTEVMSALVAGRRASPAGSDGLQSRRSMVIDRRATHAGAQPHDNCHARPVTVDTEQSRRSPPSLRTAIHPRIDDRGPDTMIALLAALTLSIQAGGTPRQLADLYLAWRGGAQFERLTAIHASGTIRVMGLDGAIDRWSTSSGGEREDRDLRVFRVSEGNGPEGGWTRGPGGQVDRMSSAARTALVEDAAIDFGAALRGAPGVALADGGDEARDGRSWRVLRASFGSGSTYDLLVDGNTGELGSERVTRDGRTTTVAPSDWHVVDGVRIAFREHVSGSLPGETRYVAYASVQLDGQPDASLLARPAARRIAVFDAGRRSTGPLPIEIFDGSRIFVNVTVGGRPVAAMIDSGAASSVVDAAFASEAGVRSAGGGAAIGAAGTAAVAIGSAKDVKVGTLTLEALPLAVMDLSGISAQIGHSLGMVIGRDLFDQIVVTIDARARTITLTDPGAFTPEKGAVAVGLQAEGPLRTVAAEVEGGAPARLHFDIGNGTPLVLYPSYWRRVGLAEGRRASKTLVGGVGGSVAADVTAVRSLSFGGVQFRDVPTILMPATGGAGDTSLVDGNIGLPVLSRFRFSVDYPHDRLWLAPATTTRTEAFERDRSGLGVQAGTSGLTVRIVAPDSPASSAGLRPGDVIVAVNNRTVTRDYVTSGLSRWRNGPAGRRVLLKLADGSTRSLKLEDTY